MDNHLVEESQVLADKYLGKGKRMLADKHLVEVDCRTVDIDWENFHQLPETYSRKVGDMRQTAIAMEKHRLAGIELEEMRQVLLDCIHCMAVHHMD